MGAPNAHAAVEGTVTDTTDLVASVMRSEERYRVLVEQASDGIMIADANGRYTEVNDAACALLGYTRAELTELTVGDLLSEQERRTNPPLSELRPDRPAYFERRLRRKDGSFVDVEISGKHLSDGRIVGIVRDLTMRRRMEEQLLFSERTLSLVFANVTDWIALLRVDSDGAVRHLRVNRAAFESLGLREDELLGQGLGVYPEPLRSALEAKCREALRVSALVQFEEACIVNGAEYSLDVQLKPLEGSSSGAETVLFVARDVTFHRAADEHFRRLSRALLVVNMCNQELVRATDERALLTAVCRHIVEIGGYKFVWVGYAENDVAKSVRPIVRAGRDEGYLQAIALSWADVPEGSGPTGLCIRTGRPVIVGDTLEDPRFSLWRDRAQARAIASTGAFPLLVGGKAFGALNIYSTRKHSFSDDEVALLSELANDLAFGVDALRTRDRSREVEVSLRQSEERLLLALEGANAGMWDWYVPSGEVFFSPTLHRLLGYEPGEIEPTIDFWKTLRHPDDRAAVEAAIDAHFVGASRAYESEHRERTKSGEFRWFLHRGKAVERDCGGRPIRVAGTVIDITERRANEERVRIASTAFDSTGEAIIVCDARGDVLSVNRAFSEITGYAPEEIVGRNPRILKSGRHDREFYVNMWSTLTKQGRWQGEVWNRRKNGEAYPQWLSLTAVTDAAGKITNYIGLASDTSERREARERIAYLAQYDTLTKLPNRVLFEDRVRLAIAAAERAGRELALLFLDLDRFKTINDSLGHEVGDLLLRAVADVVKGCLREGDTVARWGGDEFVAVLNDLTKTEEAVSVSRSIIERLSQPIAIGGAELNITPSIGIATYPQDGREMATLVKHANIAMYRAKDAGRNTYQFFTADMNARAFERLSMESNLRRALERGEFLLHYQPQVSLRSGDVIGAEALVRWKHPELGMVSPGRFIPVAEETGLIVPLGDWVIGEACAQNRRWQDDGVLRAPVAVNLSAVQFRQKRLEQTVEAAIARAGIEARFLELELTESAVMDDAEATIVTLGGLRRMGLRIAIDDFGTGYSSLSYLKRFPIDKLKIDQSFVRDITSDADDAAITSAVISMAHSLRLSVIAEGVETREQYEFLRERGCDEVQGYFLARPMAADALTELLRKGPLGPPSSRRTAS